MSNIIAKEVKHYIEERREFLSNEIIFLKELCHKGAEATDDKYFLDIEAYLDSIEELIAKASGYENTLVEAKDWDPDSCGENLYHAENIYARIPYLLHFLIISFTQRRAAGLGSLYAPAYDRSLSLGDAHPAYFITARALEEVARSFYNKIRKLLPDDAPSNAPFVTLIDAKRYAVIPPWPIKLFGARPITVAQLMFDSRIDHIKSFLSLLHVRSPRWAAGHIRHSVLLAHEMSHIFLWLVQDVLLQAIDVNEVYSRALQKEPESKRRSIEEIYGPQTVSFAGDFLQMRASFRDSADQFIKTIVKKVEHRHKNNIFWQRAYIYHCKEIFSDMFGFLLAGPAYVLSLATLSPLLSGELAPNEQDPFCWWKASTHPYTFIRLRILMRALELSGYTRILEKLNEIYDLHYRHFETFGDIIGEVSKPEFPVDPEYFKKSKIWYLEWALANADQYFKIIEKIGLENRLDKYLTITEDEYFAELERILTALKYENELNLECDSIDVLNAIWYRRLFESETPELKFHWRMLLMCKA